MERKSGKSLLPCQKPQFIEQWHAVQTAPHYFGFRQIKVADTPQLLKMLRSNFEVSKIKDV
ncbi:hypothetical protein GOV14_06595 [Candidatus Pacearchaeota archaeon]|nr:hypothetical protein [Candidatus Pacearchaeota archaeon]